MDGKTRGDQERAKEQGREGERERGREGERERGTFRAKRERASEN